MNISEISVTLLWGATTLYVIALVAYSLVVARGADRQTEVPTAGKALGIARATATVGALMHGAGVVLRGIDAGHAPWSTMYEFTITGTFVAVVVFLVVQRLRNAAYLGAGVTGLTAFSLGVALTLLYRPSTPLQPALQNYWLVVHVGIAITATGIFSVAAVATVLQLARDYRGSESRIFGRPAFSWLDGTPTPARLEALAFRLNAIGFVLWTFTVMAGAIWANEAWGRAWGWDPKEIWSLVVWIVYAAYLHARTTRGWSGRRAAYLSLVAFLVLLFNFTVVNLLVHGHHSYAGV